MSEITKIEWCDSTVNFWRVCTEVSPGCAHCYARERERRFRGPGTWGRGVPRIWHESAVKLAHRMNRKPWVCNRCGRSFTDANKGAHFCNDGYQVYVTDEAGFGFHRRRIFTESLGDWLDPEVPIEWLARMLDTIRQCDQVRWLLLTKRTEQWFPRIADALDFAEWITKEDPHEHEPKTDLGYWLNEWIAGNPPANIAIGTSVEDQERDHRIADLLRIPARWRFLSLEPLLGPVDLTPWIVRPKNHRVTPPRPICDPQLHWLIIGGESGPKARPCNVEWVRSLVRQGRDAGVPVFVKQLGANVDTVQQWGLARAVLKHPSGGDPAEWPEDLRVREQPDWEAWR